MDEGELRLQESFSEQGYLVLPRFLADHEIYVLEAKLSRDTEALAGSRALLELPWCMSLARQIRGDPRLSGVWPAGSHAVLCTYFEKSPERNWLVALHQDLSFPVAERTEASGYSGWSKKDGRLFVQPPLEVLEQSIAARVHVHASDIETGALKVVPRSHKLGRLRPQEILASRDAHGARSVPVPRGGLMLMRPLLLHASSKVIGNARRGVLHFLFGPLSLPGGVLWP
ncbi:MAG TPA: phytanoyl-CoA dioxygenase family protein [Steroidobacteraceae bacterium]|nr:phytanoyl-CoA dioxygenase family protein [Steroidobacteraceae bacterium]